MDLLHLEDASLLYIHSAPWGKVGVYNPSPELRGSLTKWYDTRVLFLRDWFKTKALRFHYLNTRVNVSDAFTKSLGQVKLDVFRPQMLGINPVDYQSAVMVRPD